MVFTLILLLTTAAELCIFSEAQKCPLWLKWVQRSDSYGYCACLQEKPRFIECNQVNEMSFLSQGSCVFYDSMKNTTSAFWCTLVSTTRESALPLPANVNELNSVVCRYFSREVKGPLCGRCTNGTGPSIYSVGNKCVPCSHVHILYYVLLQYLPSTVIFLLVVIFRPNITSAPMVNFVIFCNSIVLCMRMNVWGYIKLDTIPLKSALTLCALWSFDALLFISPELCISEHMQEIYVPFLEFLAIIFPFFLLLLTYGLIESHSRNFKPVVILWRLFRRGYVQFYRAWDPSSSMIQAFASLFFLSYARASYLIWETFTWSVDLNNKDDRKITALYFDPNVPYWSTKHLLLVVFSMAVGVFVFLPPLLILVVYPTSLYRKISHWISPKWRLRIKTYVEAFHGCLKDGTNGTRDYRAFSGLYIFVAGVVPQLLVGTIAIVMPSSLNNFLAPSYIVAIYYSLIAFIWIWLQPYKRGIHNTVTAGILSNTALICAFAESVYNTQQEESKAVKIIIAIPLLVLHFVLWGYVMWKVMKIGTTYCRGCLGGGERRELLLRSSNSMNNNQVTYESALLQPQ